MGRGGYLGIRGYRGLAVVDVATIGRSDSLLEQGPTWWDMVKWGLNCNYIPIHFFGGVWYGIHRVIDNNVIWLLAWCIAC